MLWWYNDIMKDKYDSRLYSRGKPRPKIKKCTLCGREKNLDNYYFVESRGVYQSRCKVCTNKIVYSYKLKSRKTKGSNEWWDRRYSALRKGARLSGREFRLTKEQFIELKNSSCFFCNKKYEDMTVDRIDNDEGYNQYNCVSACHSCNRIKGAVTIEMCRKIIEHFEAR